VDPGRAAVERVDGVLRDSETQLITDPTVFVKGAALGGLTLIALAKLGLARAQRPALRVAADQTVKSQQGIRSELARIAGGKRLDVPASLIYPDEQMLQQAPAGSGAAFDDWFVQHLVDELFKSSALYQAAQDMTDVQLAAFARRTLPALEAARQAAVALPRG
jgi:putative membrane protein